MKFMIEYQVRMGGLTSEQNFDNIAGVMTALAKWKPEEGLNVHAFVNALSGREGYILVEADDAKPVQAFVSKFNYWNDAKVVPVLDIEESMPAFQASLAWAKSAGRR